MNHCSRYKYGVKPNGDLPGLETTTATDEVSAATRWPDSFLVGAPKSGTTSMFAYLRQHPEFFMCPLKESHFFAPELVDPAQRLSRGAYLELFRGAKALRVGESSVWYLYSKTAAQAIKVQSPEARIIVMLRNPIETARAIHGELYYNGTEDIESFTEALAAEGDRRGGNYTFDPQRTPAPALLWYREVAKYSQQLQRYFDLFGRERVHVIIFDDFRQNPRLVFNRLCRFLAIRDDAPIDFEVHNSSKMWRAAWIRDIYFSPPGWMNAIGSLFLAPEWRKRTRHSLWRVGVAQRPRPPIASPDFRLLMDAYAEDIVELGRQLDRDFSAWLLPPLDEI